jgi:hypothetical protein
VDVGTWGGKQYRCLQRFWNQRHPAAIAIPATSSAWASTGSLVAPIGPELLRPGQAIRIVEAVGFAQDAAATGKLFAITAHIQANRQTLGNIVFAQNAGLSSDVGILIDAAADSILVSMTDRVLLGSDVLEQAPPVTALGLVYSTLVKNTDVAPHNVDVFINTLWELWQQADVN